MSEDRGILLVDDNPDDVDLALRAFAGSEAVRGVAVVRDGEEALEYLFATGRYAARDPDSLPNLILLDINLPKMGGLEVLRQIRANPKTRRLPVVILTCSNEEGDIQASYDLGANSFIRKPIDYAHFKDAARHLGTYWLVLNEPPPSRASTARSSRA